MKLPKIALCLGLFAVVFGVYNVSSALIKAHSYDSSWEHNSRYHWQKVDGSNAVINKEEHKFGELVVYTQPTEVSYGSSFHTCTVCGYNEFVRIDKIEHKHTFSNIYQYDEQNHWHPSTCEHHNLKSDLAQHTFHQEKVEPTYQSSGLIKFTCDDCGYSYTTYQSQLALEYDNNHYEQTEYGHYHKCVTPGYETYINQLEGHIFLEEENEYVAPTEENDGHLKRICSVCGYIDSVIYPALSHNHKFSTQWSQNDSHHWHAAECDHDVKCDYYPHDFIKITDNGPDYESAYIEQYRCETCGYVKTINKEAEEHHYSDNYAYTGTTHYRPCVDEGYYNLKTDEGEHDYSDFIVYDLSTCSHKGHKFHKCRVCGYIEVVELDYADHTYSSSYAYDSETHWHPASCEHTDLKSEIEEHEFTSTITTKPTFETEGTYLYTCSTCGYSYTDTIPVKEHNFSNDWSYNATNHFHRCTDVGYSELHADEEPHQFDDPVIVPEDGINNGEKYEICKICGYKHVIEIYYTLANECLKYMKFTAVTGGYEVSAGTLSNTKTKIIIPDTYNNQPVISIASNAFTSFSQLQEVVFPSNLDKIGTQAFYGLKNLTTFTLPESLKTIQKGAFKGCTSLTSVTIPSTVTSFGDYVFQNCTKLKTVIFKNKSFTLYNDVFTGCTSISDVYFNGKVEDWAVLNFATSGKSNPLVAPTNPAKLYVQDDTGSIVKEGINFKELNGFDISSNITISAYAFYKLTFTNPVNLSNVNVEKYGFYSVTLDTFTAASSVTAVGNSFVLNVTNLSIPNYPNYTLANLGISKTYLTNANIYEYEGNDTLYSAYVSNFAALKTMSIPDTITTISEYCFNNCSNLETLNKPSALTTIGQNAFIGCTKLSNIDSFAKSATSIGQKAFQGTNTYDLSNMNNNLTVIPDYCFYQNSSLTYVTLPTNLIEIGNYAFSQCSNLSAISFPNKLTTIGDSAFASCSKIENINIPASATYLGSSCFYNCTSLKSMTFSATNYTCGSNIFSNCTNLKNITVTNGVTVLRQYLFYRIISTATCSLPTSLKTIETQAFGYKLTINYAGTLAQWSAISKNPHSEYATEVYVVCSNGSTYTTL